MGTGEGQVNFNPASCFLHHWLHLDYDVERANMNLEYYKSELLQVMKEELIAERTKLRENVTQNASGTRRSSADEFSSAWHKEQSRYKKLCRTPTKPVRWMAGQGGQILNLFIFFSFCACFV